MCCGRSLMEPKLAHNICSAIELCTKYVHICFVKFEVVSFSLCTQCWSHVEI